VGLVELLNPMMTQSKWLRSQKWFMQVLSFAALYSGAAILAVIGKWA
jgi:solute carrier family 39 (zinc transporter), member 1/2/3